MVQAKECAAQYWPSLSQACSDQIAQVKLFTDLNLASDLLLS